MTSSSQMRCSLPLQIPMAAALDCTAHSSTSNLVCVPLSRRTRERSKLRRNYGVRRKSSSNRSRSSSQSSEGESCLERVSPPPGSSDEEEEEETMSITFADAEKEEKEEDKEVSPEQRERAQEKIKYANILCVILLFSVKLGT